MFEKSMFSNTTKSVGKEKTENVRKGEDQLPNNIPRGEILYDNILNKIDDRYLKNGCVQILSGTRTIPNILIIKTKKP